MNLRKRNTTMVKETDIMFVRHIVQNKRFMSSFNDIPTRKEKRIRRSILKLSENTKQMKKSKVILIVGEYGVGKSSFVNSVLTAITGRYSEHCEVAQASSSKTSFLHV